MLSNQLNSEEKITNVINNAENADFENKEDISEFLKYFAQNNAFSLQEKAMDLYKSPFIKLFVSFNIANHQLHFEATMLNKPKISNKNNYIFSLLYPDVLHSVVYFSDRINENILGTELVVDRLTDSLKRHYLKSLKQLKEFSVDLQSNYEDAEVIPFSQLNDAAIREVKKNLIEHNNKFVYKILNNIKNQSDFDEFLSYAKNDFIYFLNGYDCDGMKNDANINSIRTLISNGIDFIKTFDHSIEINAHSTVVILLVYMNIENNDVRDMNIDYDDLIELSKMGDQMRILSVLKKLTCKNVSKTTSVVLSNIFNRINKESQQAVSIYFSNPYIFQVGKIALSNKIAFINGNSLFSKLDTISTDSEKDLFIKQFVSYFEKCRKVYISIEGQFAINQFKEKWSVTSSELDRIKFELFGFEGEFNETEMCSIDI